MNSWVHDEFQSIMILVPKRKREQTGRNNSENSTKGRAKAAVLELGKRQGEI